MSDPLNLSASQQVGATTVTEQANGVLGASRFEGGLFGAGVQGQTNGMGQEQINFNGFAFGIGINATYNLSTRSFDTFQGGLMVGLGIEAFGLGGALQGSALYGFDNINGTV